MSAGRREVTDLNPAMYRPRKSTVVQINQSNNVPIRGGGKYIL